MTEDLVILKQPKEKGIYQGKTCKINDCPNTPRRNWMCANHYSALKRGTLDIYGNKILKKVIKYPKDFECIKCGKRGRISKGFCKYHYEHFRKGIIDFDGNPKREFKKIVKYTSLNFCKASQCSRRPRIRGWCQNHFYQFRKGHFNSYGMRITPYPVSNKGKTCSECEKPAVCKGLCHLHYARKQINYLGPAGYKNVGKICSNEFCSRPAVCRTMCSLHYRRFKRKLTIRSQASP